MRIEGKSPEHIVSVVVPIIPGSKIMFSVRLIVAIEEQLAPLYGLPITRTETTSPLFIETGGTIPIGLKVFELLD